MSLRCNIKSITEDIVVIIIIIIIIIIMATAATTTTYLFPSTTSIISLLAVRPRKSYVFKNTPET
jgi:flagellar basal body-associated protein FliL